jgi:hypothetical protein
MLFPVLLLPQVLVAVTVPREIQNQRRFITSRRGSVISSIA